MTLRNRCVACDYVIEAPEGMRGQETVCPKCEAQNVLLAPEDALLHSESERQAQATERAVFLRSLEQLPPSSEGVVPDVRKSLALDAGKRLRSISVYLLGFAYLLLLLALALGVVLAAGQGHSPPAWKAFSFLASTSVGVFLFIFLKFMSDVVQALADLSDLGRSIEGHLLLLTDRKYNGNEP